MFKLTKYELRKTRATLVIAAVCFAILELAYIIGLALHKENLAGGSASFLILFACFSYLFFLVLAIMNYSKEMNSKSSYLIFMTPNTPLSILSATTPEGLATAIITGNEKALTVAQGIGKKIAQRIILELKDKLAKGQLPTEGERGGVAVTVIPQDKASEAAAALAVLGYGPGEISVALKGLELEALSLEEIVRQALRRMMK